MANNKRYSRQRTDRRHKTYIADRLTEKQINTINIEKIADYIRELESAKTTDVEQILENLRRLASELFVFEKIKKEINEGTPPIKMGYLNEIKEALEDNGYDDSEVISLTEADLRNQFSYDSRRETVENIANAMYLANRIAKILLTNKRDIDKANVNKLYGLNIENTSEWLFYLKEEFLKSIIDIWKDDKEKVVIDWRPIQNTGYDEKVSRLFYIWLPKYLEPFCIRSDKIAVDEGNRDEICGKTKDIISFYRISNGIWCEYNSSIFPMKLDESQIQALESFKKIPTNDLKKHCHNRVINGVSSYFDTMLSFSPIQAKLANLRSRLTIVTDNLKRLDFLMRNAKGKKKQEEYQKQSAALKKEEERLQNSIDGISKFKGEGIDGVE